ncbi:MAG TPA: hypothetical protein VGS12_09670 [Caulobacteraceae bacterium]|nr:hypothetical protein [Caulobacteraceae bacterium]
MNEEANLLAAPPALLFDLLESLAAGPRPYVEVMEAWRTSCPRLPVWEDALEDGLIRRGRVGRGPAVVALTPLGREHLGRGRI